MWSSAGDAKLSRLHEVNQLMYVKQCSRVISQRQAFLIFSLRNLRAEGREPLKHSACLEYTRKNLNTLNMPPLNFESDKSLSEISLHRSTGNFFFLAFLSLLPEKQRKETKTFLERLNNEEEYEKSCFYLICFEIWYLHSKQFVLLYTFALLLPPFHNTSFSSLVMPNTILNMPLYLFMLLAFFLVLSHFFFFEKYISQSLASHFFPLFTLATFFFLFFFGG